MFEFQDLTSGYKICLRQLGSNMIMLVEGIKICTNFYCNKWIYKTSFNFAIWKFFICVKKLLVKMIKNIGSPCFACYHRSAVGTYCYGCMEPKIWTKRSNRSGIFVGFSSVHFGTFVGFSFVHSSDVQLVLNLQTGHISSQIHVFFDDDFTTVWSLGDTDEVPDFWKQLRLLLLEEILP